MPMQPRRREGPPAGQAASQVTKRGLMERGGKGWRDVRERAGREEVRSGEVLAEKRKTRSARVSAVAPTRLRAAHHTPCRHPDHPVDGYGHCTR